MESHRWVDRDSKTGLKDAEANGQMTFELEYQIIWKGNDPVLVAYTWLDDGAA